MPDAAGGHDTPDQLRKPGGDLVGALAEKHDDVEVVAIRRIPKQLNTRRQRAQRGPEVRRGVEQRDQVRLFDAQLPGERGTRITSHGQDACTLAPGAARMRAR